MADELKDQRVVTMMSPSELEAIDDWMFENRIRSRGEAIRRLCQMGIIFDREIRPVMDRVVDGTRRNMEHQKKFSAAEYQQFFQDMAITMINAKTAFSKLESEPATDEAINALTKLYAYWKAHK